MYMYRKEGQQKWEGRKRVKRVKKKRRKKAQKGRTEECSKDVQLR
jgi:hypothetical protein